MNRSERTLVNVQTLVKLPVARIWDLWTDPWHIIHWNQASAEWHTARAENDVKKNGRFSYRMEARDGSVGFDFSGEYRKVIKNKSIEYFLDDSRIVSITFSEDNNETLISESFEAEETYPVDYQREGWQSILNNFKNYAETSERFRVLHYEILINAPADKVYRTMLEKELYAAWTSIFNPSCRFEGSWDKGSKILFLGEDKEGKTNGMVSWIKDNIPNRSIKIEHQGIVKDGEEIMTGPEVEQWKGSIESYGFISMNDKTLLSVDFDSVKEFEVYFSQTWPEVLKKLKSICEK
ncbi:MAG TPA: hypothetical protein DDY34_16790 [Bacteroidales bacterium]|nr:hypothetical protein [Bacteroidales bacterium]HBQ81738.1 hypothetical protein [Bacteroidales bacterium]HCU19345.1 hypothetical protein [Bacteroidales bacterium]